MDLYKLAAMHVKAIVDLLNQHDPTDKIVITVSYHGANQEIGDIWLSCHEGEKSNPLINSMNEIKNRFKTIKELNSFLLKYHNEFFYTYRESELIEVIKKYSPARKTITF